MTTASIRPFSLAAAAVLGLAASAGASPGTIDLALCLDTSGSMSGLINAARQKLWAIVDEMSQAQPAPKLRVALLTFGNDGHDPENGWVSVDSPFTDDLDVVSQTLFAMQTNGGTEYVGRVLQYADQLAWSPSGDALKIVVVAGNESADQDREVPFQSMCQALVARGIMVNALYCGSPEDDVAPGWREVARLADGRYASIDHDHGTIVIPSPFDDRLAELNSALNETYLPFGARGEEGRTNQLAQDANAASLNSEAAASRCAVKAQGLYFCAWDLVDACDTGQVKLDEIEVDELPEAMQTMTGDQRRHYVEQTRLRRAEIKREIDQITAKRKAFVADEMKRRAVDDSNAFDGVLRRSIREQAAERGFQFDDGC